MAETTPLKTSNEARKSRAPRLPARERGIQRFAILLDATDALLGEKHVDEIGLYGIAERAGVPPASVYHFFPSTEGAFFALAQRYLNSFLELFAQPVEPEAFSDWLVLMARDQQLSVDFFNSHPAAMKLFLGRYGGEETRKADIQFNRDAGTGLWRRLRFAFEMPVVSGAPRIFTNMLSIQDALWASSYAEHGCIIQAYAEESRRACKAYLRLYFPEYIALRPKIAALVSDGLPVVLDRQETAEPSP